MGCLRSLRVAVLFATALAGCSFADPPASADATTGATPVDTAPDVPAVSAPDLPGSDAAPASDSASDAAPAPDSGPPVAWVNPFIGTGFTGGNVGSSHPGATRPFGLVKASPDTVDQNGKALGALHCAGYQYADPDMTGLSHTRLQGTGVPDILAPTLFSQAGRPDLADEWTRWIGTVSYTTAPDGLIGNDDAGTLSAWYVLAAVGLLPRPCVPGYDLVAPRFERAVLHLPTGEVVIEAPGASQGASFGAVTWNQEPLAGRWIDHAALVQGGTLRFQPKP